jgi:hypothetical protein
MMSRMAGILLRLGAIARKPKACAQGSGDEVSFLQFHGARPVSCL